MRPIRFVIAMASVLGFAACAGAQDDVAESRAEVAKLQIAGGFSSVHDLATQMAIPPGWFVTVDKNVNESFGLTYDLSASGTLTRRLAYVGIESHWATGALLLGPTFFHRYERRAVVFGRVLGGIGEAGSSEDGYAAALAIAPGAGVDLYFARRLGLRVTGEWRSLHGIGVAAGARASQVWLRAGVVVALGTR